jgi:1,4-alpha-glucan branching enzyme
MAKHRFRIFAPYNESVSLVGSWAKRAIPLRRDDAGYWEVSAEVPDGVHHYQFRLKSLSHFMAGQTVDVTDPYARRVDEMRGDAGVLVYENGRDVTTEYDWSCDDVPLPQDHELVLYELHVGEFGARDDKPGTFLSVIPRLDYLRDLGVNAVEIMPVGAFPYDQSWGYNVRHACAVENAYGTPQDLKRLIDACHGRGIRVILDIVFNHMEVESPLNKVDFYYWFRDPKEGEPSYGPKLDYERWDDNLKVHPARDFSRNVALYWLREYHVDGFRLDATAVIDNYDFIREIRRVCEESACGKPFYLIAEHIPEDPSIAGPGPDAPVDGAWRIAFCRNVTAALCEDTVEGTPCDYAEMLKILHPASQGYVAPNRAVNYIESHDEHTLMEQMGARGILGDAAFRKAKLGATLLFTAVGNPMLYQGQEFGGHRPHSQEIRPLQWELLDGDFGLHLKEHYAFLARLRRESPALTGEDFAVVHADTDAGLLVYRRGYGEAEMVVAVNLRDEDTAFDIPFPDGDWRERFFDFDLTVSGGRLADTLPASGAKIYVHR